MLRNSIRKARTVRSLDEAREAGFTLIELLIVIVILGVLAGIVVFSVQGITNTGDEAACQSNVKTVLVASEAFRAQSATRVYAADMAALVTAGLIKSEPADVAYTAGATAADAPTIAGAAGTACAGFTG